MAEGKHTPGPWFLMTETLRGAHPGRVHVGHYCDDGTAAHLPRTEANASLIAAAPELLEALEWALSYGSFDVAVDNPLHARRLDKARAALAKAKGEG